MNNDGRDVSRYRADKVTLCCPQCNVSMSALPENAHVEAFACSYCGSAINVWSLRTPSGRTLAEYEPDIVWKKIERLKVFSGLTMRSY